MNNKRYKLMSVELSVICPIYNEEKYIAQFLDSLLLQDYPKEKLEILLVDGMSKDKTREIVADYTAKYQFVRLIDNPDKIVPYAMNRGIDVAKGDIIMQPGCSCFISTRLFLSIGEWVETPERGQCGYCLQNRRSEQNT